MSEGNLDGINNFEQKNNGTLKKAYLSIHEKEPPELQDWEMARQIVEVLDDPNWIDPALAKECIYLIVHKISYPDEKTKNNIILMAEEKARNVFPELYKVDEVHMDQIDYAYNKWRRDEESEDKKE